ncbi:ECF transporter S component [Ruminococcus sp. 5_1_39BFAA]|uniref:ECF transporter S component n=1 Tax=Ruminococcus sp. 5_1_39BFAA TaxID=457412 RepID=UPI00356AFBB9
MEKGQGTGRDTRVMIPVFCCIYMAIALIFLPWFSVPVLKYDGFPKTYTLWNVKECVDNINACVSSGGRWQMETITSEETDKILSFMSVMKICAVILVVLLCAGAVFAYWKRKKSVPLLKIIFGLSILFCAAACFGGFWGNSLINGKMGREENFFNYTVNSFLQLTSYVYAAMFLSILMIFSVNMLLDTEKEDMPAVYMDRTVKEDRKIGKRTKVSVLIILVGIPLVIFFGIFFLNDRSSVFIGMCINILAMLPFLMVFEDRNPQAREILLIAVMAAIAVVGRVAFFMLPQFKPVSAIVIITGVSLGPEAGFLTGTMAGFVSNFFFGQGPWTAWQMFSFGITGFLAGVLFRRRKKDSWDGHRRFWLCAYGGAATFGIYGLIVDCASMLNFTGGFSWASFLAILASGLPFNLVHGLSTVIFLYFLADPMCRKLERIKKKYGILER